ncbi:MAG TPA: hypothetical protein VF590_12805 [Isosphaeraceae bacterium]
MPEGSLAGALQTLEGALAGVTGLLGTAPGAGAPGSGLAGAAGLAARTPVDRVRSFADGLTGQVAGILRFDGAVALSATTDLFATLSAEVRAPASDGLADFAGRIGQVSSAFSGDFVGGLQQALAAIRGISGGVPSDRTAIVSALLDQILGVLASLDGPEAAQIRAWGQAVEEQSRAFGPLIAEVQAGADPADLVVAVVRRALESTLETLGFGPAQKLVESMERLAADVLPPARVDAALTLLAAVPGAYGQAQAAAALGFPEFRGAVIGVTVAIDGLTEGLRPILGAIRRLIKAPIVQPGALEDFLRHQIETALGVTVDEVQKIDDPLKALFDRIDAAIGRIDLSRVRTEVLGFFETTRATIEAVDIPSIGRLLQEQLAPVQGTIQDLEQGVTALLQQIQATFAGLAERARMRAGRVGNFAPDGTFHFHVEQDLHNLLDRARRAIGGDPADPTAPSVAGTLGQIQAAIDGFLGQLGGLLDPAQAAVEGVRTTALSGINDFAAFLQGLDVAALIETLRGKVQEILDAVVPIDFAIVVDPVIADIDENTETLRGIDPTALNALLREALGVALDVVIHIDFAATIRGPLKAEFARIKAVPAGAIAALQRRYEQALGVLERLNPGQMLAALVGAFDVIDRAVGALDVAALLEPLDRVHQEHLVAPLATLKPSTLLRPVAEGFDELTEVLDDVRGAAIIAPLDAQLGAVKSAVAGLNITGWVDDVLAAVGRVQQVLRAIRPSGLLEPLVADFERLESELDRFQPSALFRPVADLAGPLLAFLEGIQEATIRALHEVFQAPLRVLDALEPEALLATIRGQIDAILAALDRLGLATRFNQIKGQFFDLKAAVQTDEVRLSLVTDLIDPQPLLGEVVATVLGLRTALVGLKQNQRLPGLAALHAELKDRMLGLLPPFARELLDPETFKRVMRLADPTRFRQELDARFEALKARLVPIRPREIAAELDAAYDAVLALVDGLDIGASLNQVKDTVEQLRGIVGAVRVDFLADDIDRAVAELRAVVGALDVSRLFPDLDAIHHEVEQVVAGTRPAQVLGGLQATLDRVQGLVGAIDPRVTLATPLNAAWEAVEGVLGQIDFTVILAPIVAKLDELEAQLLDALRRTEAAFDAMLGAGRAALGGGAGVSAGVGGSL